MKIKTIDVQPNPQGKFPCPECEAVYNDRAHLGIHRKTEHRIEGTTHTAKKMQALRKNPRPVGRPRGVKNHKSMRGRANVVDAREVERMLALTDKGLSQREIAKKLGRSLSCVQHQVSRTQEFKANSKGVSPNGSHPASPPSESDQSLNNEAWFRLGQLYTAFEKDLDQLTASPGCPITIDIAALWVGDTLRAKAAKIRQLLRNTELLHEMRQELPAAGGGREEERGGYQGPSALHVRSRPKRSLSPRRTMSASARAKIGRAQRLRWAKHWAKAKRENRASA